MSFRLSYMRIFFLLPQRYKTIHLKCLIKCVKGRSTKRLSLLYAKKWFVLIYLFPPHPYLNFPHYYKDAPLSSSHPHLLLLPLPQFLFFLFHCLSILKFKLNCCLTQFFSSRILLSSHFPFLGFWGRWRSSTSLGMVWWNCHLASDSTPLMKSSLFSTWGAKYFLALYRLPLFLRWMFANPTPGTCLVSLPLLFL